MQMLFVNPKPRSRLHLFCRSSMSYGQSFASLLGAVKSSSLFCCCCWILIGSFRSVPTFCGSCPNLHQDLTLILWMICCYSTGQELERVKTLRDGRMSWIRIQQLSSSAPPLASPPYAILGRRIPLFRSESEEYGLRWSGYFPTWARASLLVADFPITERWTK